MRCWSLALRGPWCHIRHGKCHVWGGGSEHRRVWSELRPGGTRGWISPLILSYMAYVPRWKMDFSEMCLGFGHRAALSFLCYHWLVKPWIKIYISCKPEIHHVVKNRCNSRHSSELLANFRMLYIFYITLHYKSYLVYASYKKNCPLAYYRVQYWRYIERITKNRI